MEKLWYDLYWICFLDYFQKNKSDVIVEDNSNLSKVLTDNKPVIFVLKSFL